LDGIPISIKGNIAVRGLPLTAGSDILTMVEDGGGGGGCGYDSYVVQKLVRESGAVLIGLTTMDEFGMGSLGTNLNSRRYRDRDRDRGGECEYEEKEEDGYTKNPLPYIINHHNHHANATNNDDENWIHKIKTLDIGTTTLLTPIPNTTPTPIQSPGGSSSGSATSISHGSTLASIGTDTGGSIRLPASWCGVVGMKPTYGLISRHGVVSYASSLDTVGVIGASVECCGLVLDALVNRDVNGCGGVVEEVKDATAVFYPGGDSVCRGIRHITATSDDILDTDKDTTTTITTTQKQPTTTPIPNSKPKPLKGLKIGIPAAFSLTECPTEIQCAWLHAIQTLQSHGATTHILPPTTLSPETIKRSLPAYYVIACAEASSNLARYDGLRYGMTYDPTNIPTKGGTPKGGTSPKKSRFFTDDMNPREHQYSTVRAQGFGPEVIRRILCGTAVLSSDRFHTHYEAAEAVRKRVRDELGSAFRCRGGDGIGDGGDGDGDDGVDLMVIPTALTPPPHLNAATTGDDGEERRQLDATEAFANDVMTVPISLAGLPSISVPVYREDYCQIVGDEGDEDISGGGGGVNNDDEGMVEQYNGVIGIQIFGPKFSEETVLTAAHVLER